MHGHRTPFFTLAGTATWCRVTDVIDGRTCHVVFDMTSVASGMTNAKTSVASGNVSGSGMTSNRHKVCRFIVQLRDVPVRDVPLSNDKNPFLHWLLPNLFKLDGNYNKNDILAMLWANPVYKYLRIHDYDRYGRCIATLHNSSFEGGECVNDYVMQ
jgi:hypothetical protein